MEEGPLLLSHIDTQIHGSLHSVSGKYLGVLLDVCVRACVRVRACVCVRCASGYACEGEVTCWMACRKRKPHAEDHLIMG